MKKAILIILLIVTIGLFACDKPHEHAFGEWVVVKEATELEEGSKERVCECGEKETQAIEKLAHTHAYGEWVVVKEATEEEEGSKERTCSCGEKETEAIAKLEHVHNFVEGKCVCGETTEVLVESVTFTGKGEMLEGEEQTLVLSVLPEYATNKEVVWTSSDDSVATVDNGLVKAVKAGTVTIKAVAKDGSNAEYSFEIAIVKGQMTVAELQEKLSSTLKAYLAAEKASVNIKMETGEEVLNQEYAFELKGDSSFTKLYDKLSGFSDVSIFIKDEMIYMNANDVKGKYPIDDSEISDIFDNHTISEKLGNVTSFYDEEEFYSALVFVEEVDGKVVFDLDILNYKGSKLNTLNMDSIKLSVSFNNGVVSEVEYLAVSGETQSKVTVSYLGLDFVLVFPADLDNYPDA